MDLFEKIHKRFPNLSPNQKKVGEYLTTDGTTASFASVRELAEIIGISESSVVRFAQELGYRGYPELRQEVRQEVKKRLGAAARMRGTLFMVQGEDGLLPRLFQQDIELIDQTLAINSQQSFRAAIDLIWNAQRVYIIGLRSSFSLAYFLYFRLLRMGIDTRLIFITGSTSLFEQLALLQRRDLLLAIGFADIPTETIIALSHALEVRAKILGITHLPTSEIGRKATVTLLSKRGTHSMVQSLTAPFALLNALAIGVATAKRSKSLSALSRLDKMRERYWESQKRSRQKSSGKNKRSTLRKHTGIELEKRHK